MKFQRAAKKPAGDPRDRTPTSIHPERNEGYGSVAYPDATRARTIWRIDHRAAPTSAISIRRIATVCRVAAVVARTGQAQPETEPNRGAAPAPASSSEATS